MIISVNQNRSHNENIKEMQLSENKTVTSKYFKVYNNSHFCNGITKQLIFLKV